MAGLKKFHTHFFFFTLISKANCPTINPHAANALFDVACANVFFAVIYQ